MKSGEVVHIRVNPEDVMACIDICKKAQVYIVGMSLAQVVRVALSGLLESARSSGVIPRREGFEYAEMVQPILAVGRNGKKLSISSAIEIAEANRAAFDKPTALAKVEHSRHATGGSPQTITALDHKKARVLRLILEMEQRKAADASNWEVGQEAAFVQAKEMYDEMVAGRDVDVSSLFGGAP
jgi:hypothetical protein